MGDLLETLARKKRRIDDQHIERMFQIRIVFLDSFSVVVIVFHERMVSSIKSSVVLEENIVYFGMFL